MQYTIKFTLYPLHIAFIYLMAIAAAETVTAVFDPWIGIGLHVVVLAAIIVHAVLSWYNPSRRFLLSLLFAPIIRMLSLSLPLTDFPLIYWFLITSIPLFALILMVVQVLEYQWSEVGMTLRKPLIQLAVAPTGLIFGVVEYFILRPDPLIPAFSWSALIVPSLILLISTGFFEELAFRGIMQTTAMEVLGRNGVIYVALIFAALHIGYQSPLDVLFVFGVGAFFGWIVMQTGSILGVTLAHGLTNIVLFLIMPFLFAGYSLQQPPPLSRTPIATGVSNVPILSESTAESSTVAERSGTPENNASDDEMTHAQPETSGLEPLSTPVRATSASTSALSEPLSSLGSTIITQTVKPTDTVDGDVEDGEMKDGGTGDGTATGRLIEKLTVPATPLAASTPPPTATVASTGAPTNTPAPPRQATATLTTAPTLPPTPTPTLTPTQTPTQAPTLTPTSTSTLQPEVVALQPENGFTSDSFVTFAWELNTALIEGQQLELIFWKPGQDPLADGMGLMVDGADTARVNLRQLDIMLRDAFEPGEYQWGIVLIETEPEYSRLRYLGGGQSIRFIEAPE